MRVIQLFLVAGLVAFSPNSTAFESIEDNGYFLGDYTNIDSKTCDENLIRIEERKISLSKHSDLKSTIKWTHKLSFTDYDDNVFIGYINNDLIEKILVTAQKYKHKKSIYQINFYFSQNYIDEQQAMHLTIQEPSFTILANRCPRKDLELLS